MVGLANESDTREPALALATHGLWRAVLAGMPSGSALVFDHELRLQFAQGDDIPLAWSAVVGARLHDVMTPDVWDAAQQPCEAALSGHTTRFHLDACGTPFSIHVSPISFPGLARGGLVVSHAVAAQTPSAATANDAGPSRIEGVRDRNDAGSHRDGRHRSRRTLAARQRGVVPDARVLAAGADRCAAPRNRASG